MNKPVVILVLIMAMPCLAKAQELLELRVNGIPTASPQLNSIFGNEIGGVALDQAANSARKQIEAKAGEVGAREKGLMREADALQNSVNSRLRHYVIAAPGSIVRSNGQLGQPNPFAVETYDMARRLYDEAKRDEVLTAAATRNKTTLIAVLSLELAKMDTSTLQKWSDRVKARDKAVLNEVINSSPGLLQSRIVDPLNGTAVALIKAQLPELVVPALEKATNLSPSDKATLEQSVSSGLTTLHRSAIVVDALVGKQGVVRVEQTKTLIASYNSAATGLHDFAGLVEKEVRSKGDKLRPMERAAMVAAVQLGQQFLQGEHVSHSDVKSALDRSGLKLPNGTQLTESLSKLSDIRKPEVLAQGLSDVQGYLELASAIGIKVDKGTSRAIGTAQAAASVAAAYMTGNYLGAVSGVMGMFGGGGLGGDSGAAQQHAQVMAALGEIKELQIKTLKAIEELSKQLAKTTEVILEKLDHIDDSVAYLLALNYTDVTHPVTLCREFLGSAIESGMKDGYFPSYNVRRDHFRKRAQDINRNYIQCQEFLTANLLLTNFGSEPALPTRLLNVDLARNVRRGTVGDSKTIWRFDKRTYFPMVSYTVQALELGTPLQASNGTQFTYKEPCSTKFIAALAAAPASVHDVHPARMKCLQGETSPASEGLRLASAGFKNQFLAAGPLFDVPINAPLISELVKYANFFQTYQPLIVSAGKGSLDLMTENQLAEGKRLNKTREDGALINLSAALDVLNVTIAQQALLSGLYVANYASAVLKQWGFGKSAPQPNDDLKKPAVITDEGCAPHRNLASSPYHTTVCMLVEHPEFARNVVMHMVAQDTNRAAVTFKEYANLFDSGNATQEDIVVSFPTIYPYMRKKGDSWFIEVTSQLLTEPFLLSLPSALMLQAGTVAYPESMPSLLMSRAALLQHLASDQRTTESAAIWATARRPDSALMPVQGSLPIN